ncbi:MAG: hypothetical protein IIA89_08120 [Chloroflexi bacterium]|nr:hypothetical protein [Chloroflexota bacterium]
MAKMAPKTTARSIPKSLAPVIEGLELRQPILVTKALLAEIIEEHGLRLRPEVVAHRLQKAGWLLSLRRKDAWEFAPASRAGPINSGDQFIELRAILKHRPSFPVAIAYESAAWMHNLARRSPDRDVIAIPKDRAIPKTLKSFRITRRWGKLDPVQITDLPTWRIETLIVLMAERPTAYKAWPSALEWLPDAAGAVGDDLLFEELTDRGRPVWVRTGYLIEAADNVGLANRIYEQIAPLVKGPYYFGTRRRPGIYNKKWNVRDSSLLGRWKPGNQSWGEPR